MANQPYHLAKSSLAYAKLVATPSDDSWAQAYNAGNLFIVLALTKAVDEEDISLQAIGKDIFNNLEAEFFPLEKKNLATIKEALQNGLQHIPAAVTVNFCLAYFAEDILYLFIQGA